MNFPARYDGWCSRCKTAITIGDTLTYTDDDGAIHAHCQAVEPDDPLAVGKRETVCPDCYLIHAGECA